MLAEILDILSPEQKKEFIRNERLRLKAELETTQLCAFYNIASVIVENKDKLSIDQKKLDALNESIAKIEECSKKAAELKKMEG